MQWWGEKKVLDTRIISHNFKYYHKIFVENFFCVSKGVAAIEVNI